jgi:glycerate kinase
MHILIAPNAFKNSLDAIGIAEAIAKGLRQSRLDCTTECFPIADGGDGTGSLIVERCNGVRIQQEVHDPIGRKILSSFGLIEDGNTAVIEMADASGLRLLTKDERNPMIASSYGTGELVRAALDKGANRIIIAMGGSATVDGGCGILNALGINFLDTEGNQLKAVPQELIGVDRIDISGLDERITVTEIVILCDVSNNLLGPQGAAAVYGPQKGASAADVEFLDTFLENFVAVTSAQTGQNIDEIKYGGAAGGASAGLYAWLGAKLVNGIDYFLTLTDFDKALNRADLVITGEGSIDNQTLQGKGPYGVAVRAKAKGIPVIGLGGKVEPGKEMEDYFDELICINPESVDIDVAMKNTKTNLIKTAKMIGDRMTLIN